MALFKAHRKSIEVYLRTLLPTAVDVDDVFQETSLVLWREFQGFTVGTNFAAWACKIAFNRVRAWRARRSRESQMFSNTLALEISDELISNTEFYDARLLALCGCIGQLKPHHRELLRLRYELGESVESIAKSTDQSVEAVYRMLSRIRHQLFDCVTCQVTKPE
jgi:RNA polymerase sigma-70 factor (ECF subfamily)